MGHLNERFTGIGRPRLPPEALDRIREAENLAIETLQKSIRLYTPANPDFVFQPSEINAGCWKVIDHLAAFAEGMFDIQAAEYARVYPELVREGNILAQEIRPEVVKRTKLLWTKWETLVDFALRARWTTEYYRAYLEEGNRPGSEDEKLVRHFLARLDELVAARLDHWQKPSPKPDPVQDRPEPDETGGTLTQQPPSLAGAASVESLKAERERRLGAAKERWRPTAGRDVPFSWIHAAAGVDHKDAYDWNNGKLSESSIMTKSIDRILNQPSPPTAPTRE